MYYIIANGNNFKGKKARALETVKKVFGGAGIDYEIHFTERKGHAKELTRKFTSSEGGNAVIAMGGDGTLHEVVNGFVDFEKNSLGLIPNGTGNDFACAAGIPANAELAAQIIAYRAPRPIDFIEFENGLRSINAVGMGIDVDVLKRAYSGADASKGKYLRALISSLVHFESVNFTAHFSGREEKRYGLIAAIGNGRQIGGGIKLFPEAKINDGKMDLIIADYISKPKILGAFTKLMSGKVNKIKQVTCERVTDVTFAMESENYTVQADGELYDNIPFKAHIVAGKLKFFLP